MRPLFFQKHHEGGLPLAVQGDAQRVQAEQYGTGQDKGPLGLGWPRRGRVGVEGAFAGCSSSTASVANRAES